MPYYNPALIFGSIPMALSKDDESFGSFYKKICDTIRHDRFLVLADGVPYMVSPHWVRDHVHEMKGFRHWERELKPFIEELVKNQTDEGYFYEIMTDMYDYHVCVVDDSLKKYDPENNRVFIRTEWEADVEYLVVEGVYYIYKATGDDTWVRKILPALEKAINYSTSSPKRWDEEHGLVKRGFTIDTWDFVSGQDTTHRQISDSTPMSLMHGDNSGIYQAMQQLAWINRRLGMEDVARQWESRAVKLLENINRYLWNGTIYTHQVHLNHEGIRNEDETKRLSLSNAYDMNRGICTQEQIDSIVGEYQRRRVTTKAFAEWYTIDPPYFPAFGGPNNDQVAAGHYINGSIVPFVGAELARAALNNGHEAYGWDILSRIRKLVERDGELYYMYTPDENGGEDMTHGGGPSGWTAGTIIEAVEQGVAGIIDTGVCYETMKFTPRWAITGIKEVKYITGYEISHSLVETLYLEDNDKTTIYLRCPSSYVDCHILLPEGKQVAKVMLDSEEISFTESVVCQSHYVDFVFERDPGEVSRIEWKPHKKTMIEILFK